MCEGVRLSERNNSSMVTQQEPWTNLSVTIYNLVLIAISSLNKTSIKCLPDIPYGIAITKQNIIHMIHFKHNESL